MQDNQNSIPEEELESSIITLTDEETGEEFEFLLIAEATIEDKLYYALMPKDDEESEEYVILRVSGEGDDQILETVDDDEEFDDED